ncbi:MAG TPA: hypothetical protein VNA14_02955 [Mycobacteriales bacterium]|nr:hypothetical protein [Mycobacteriales bacterium]
MRNLHRIVSTVVAVGAIFPIGLPAASAAEVKLPVEVSAWFWDDQQDDTSVGSTPAPASGVPAGDLAVAITTGAGQAAEVQPNDPADPADDETQKRSNKETFLQWDLSAYPEGSIVEKFLVTLFVDPAGRNASIPLIAIPGQPARAGQPNIIACRPLVGFGEGEGVGYVSKPALDCRDSFSGSYDDVAKSYTFDLTVFAQDWVDGLIDNRGIGIRPEVDEDDPFQLTFLGAAKVLTLAEIIPAEIEEEIPELAPVPDSGGSADSDFSGGTTTFEPAPVVEVAPAPAPAPVANPAPVAPQPAVAFFNRSARPVERDLTVGPSFWLALLAGVGLLGVVSLVLGDPVVPVTGQRTNGRTGRPSPVGETLRARRAGVAIRPRSI